MKIFPENRFIHILAAAFQVAAGINVGKLLSISDATQFFWCSDHCVIVRTAILLQKRSRQSHFFVPHGPSFGTTSSVRDRSIFDFVYAENELQKKVFLAWNPKLKVIQLDQGKARDNKKRNCDVAAEKKALFLNQLDVGLNQKNEFSRELQYTIEFLKDYKELVVVLKNKTQLEKLRAVFRIKNYYFGFESFKKHYSAGSIQCFVLSSGVSVDLMLGGYDVLISKSNPLAEDEKARKILNLPEPGNWGTKNFLKYAHKSKGNLCINILENKMIMDYLSWRILA